ncbi:hypothetical protein [Arthrobacter sp. efr-133-R2A-120]|uniref:hypothetical protein n=1 Tax=Arthrobacter sp. efr-133-R2A-120 TaxID=3040277 RepID=UPI00254E53C6|nr:hypothetical protein [Arthrobacter sp. efr-133-R2A-120]
MALAELLKLPRLLDFLEISGRRCVRCLGLVTHGFLLVVGVSIDHTLLADVTGITIRRATAPLPDSPA